MAEKNLEKNKRYIEKNRSKLLSNYRNKYLLVYNEKVVDSYDSYEAAASEAIRAYGPDGKFLIYLMTDIEPLNFVLSAML